MLIAEAFQLPRSFGLSQAGTWRSEKALKSGLAVALRVFGLEPMHSGMAEVCCCPIPMQRLQMRSLNPEIQHSSGKGMRGFLGLASPSCVHFVMSSDSELALGEKSSGETYGFGRENQCIYLRELGSGLALG